MFHLKWSGGAPHVPQAFPICPWVNGKHIQQRAPIEGLLQGNCVFLPVSIACKPGKPSPVVFSASGKPGSGEIWASCSSHTGTYGF